MRDAIARTTLVGIRLAGQGIYFPAHVKPDGTKVNARFEGTFAVNKSYIDANQQRQEKVDYLRCIAWNGNQAVAGKGFADMLAKYCPPGKEIKYAMANVKTYDGRVFDPATNTPIQMTDGTFLVTKKVSFDLDSQECILGEDSNKALQAEYAMFVSNGGCLAFDARPAGWRTPGDVGMTQWNEILAWRGAQVFNPQIATYGYAKAGSVPAGSTIVASHTAPVVGATVATPAVAAPVVAPVVAPVAAVVAPLPAPVVAAPVVAAPVAVATPVAAPVVAAAAPVAAPVSY